MQPLLVQTMNCFLVLKLQVHKIVMKMKRSAVETAIKACKMFLFIVLFYFFFFFCDRQRKGLH